MPTPVYPSDLPGPSSYALRSSNQLVEPDGVAEGEIYTSRRRTIVPGATAGVSFRFIESDFRAWVAFWKEDLLRGMRWFYLTLPSAGGMVPHLVRIIGGRYTHKQIGFRAVTVECELEIRERRFDDFAIPPDVIATFWFDPPVNMTVSNGGKTVSESNSANSYAWSASALTSGLAYLEIIAGLDEAGNCDCYIGVAEGNETAFQAPFGTGRMTRGSGGSAGGGSTPPDEFVNGCRVQLWISVALGVCWAGIDGVYSFGGNPSELTGGTTYGPPGEPAYIAVRCDNDGASHTFTIADTHLYDSLGFPRGF